MSVFVVGVVTDLTDHTYSDWEITQTSAQTPSLALPGVCDVRRVILNIRTDWEPGGLGGLGGLHRQK